VTPAGALLRDEIRRAGPVPFSRFMSVALYHPETGYYRRQRDPFGRHGDFYTAAQLQPAFGRLMGAAVRGFMKSSGIEPPFTMVDLGAGRAEMRETLAEFRYVPVDFGKEEMPARFEGCLLANEFFDALPVDVVVFDKGVLRDRLVGCEEDRFVWAPGGEAAAETLGYCDRFLGPMNEGDVVETQFEALRWMGRVRASLACGIAVIADYGYTAREWDLRHRHGTLMSYRGHRASGDVLEEPGGRDITAHVNFTALEHAARAQGFRVLWAGLLESFIVAHGMETMMTAAGARERLQWKTLLGSLGGAFRVLVLDAGRARTGEKPA